MTEVKSTSPATEIWNVCTRLKGQLPPITSRNFTGTTAEGDARAYAATLQVPSSQRVSVALVITEQRTGKEPYPAVVVFRKYRKEPCEVIALFPLEPGDYAGRLCICYVHFGQHGSADYTGVIRDTRQATEAEYASLKRELEQIGYKLTIRKRYTKRR